MAEALRCTQCGASLPPLTPEVASVQCPSCAAVTRVDGALLERLHGHTRRVGDYEGRTENAREAALMAELTGSFGKGWAVAFVISWLVAGVVAMPETALASALALAVFAAPMVVMALVGRRRLARLRAAAARAGPRPVLVWCPGCGGQSELIPAAPVRACRYCSGALAADAAALAELIRSARARMEAEQRVATQERWRLAAKQGQAPRTDLVPFFVVGGIGSLWVIGTLLATARVILVDAATPSLVELAVMNVISLAIVLGVGLPLLWRRAELRRWRASVDALAAHSDASVSTQLSSFAEWLVAHWRGELSARLLRAGLGYLVLTSSEAGRWVLCVAPLTQEEHLVERHLRILIPGHPGPFLDEIRASLEPLGFRARVEDGGLIAELPLSETRARDELDATREAVDALNHHGALAAALGRVPSHSRDAPQNEGSNPSRTGV